MTTTTEQIEGTPLKLTKHNPGYWQVTFDDPPLNVFTPELLTGLSELVQRMKENTELRVIVFDSAVPDFFIAHFDVIRGGEILNRKTDSGMLPWFDVAWALRESPVVSIVAIRGRCRGVGIEFSGACDMRFASEKAIFGQFEVGVSTIPGGGSMEFLPLIVGRSRALEIIIGTEDLDAVTAEKYGLINRLIPDSELDEFVHKLALRISRFSQAITRLAKTMLNERAPKPAMENMVASRAAFVQSYLAPERARVAEKLKEWGIQEDSDFERNVGAYMNKIAD